MDGIPMTQRPPYSVALERNRHGFNAVSHRRGVLRIIFSGGPTVAAELPGRSPLLSAERSGPGKSQFRLALGEPDALKSAINHLIILILKSQQG
jgi:hypothetical protein